MGRGATCLDGELAGSVTELSQRWLKNERDYVQAHILVHPPSGLRLNRPRRIPSPNIHRSDPFNPMIGDPASKSSYWAQSLNRPMAKGEFEDSWWKGLPHIRNHLPPSLPAKPWYLGFFFHPDNSQTTGQIWDTSARGNSCPEMRGKGSTTKSFEVNRRWRQTEDKKCSVVNEGSLIGIVVCILHSYGSLKMCQCCQLTYILCWSGCFNENFPSSDELLVQFLLRYFFSLASLRSHYNAGKSSS